MSQRRTIRGKDHDLVVLYVTKRDPNGLPREARFLYDDETHQVKEGDEFVTAYIPTANLRKRS